MHSTATGASTPGVAGSTPSVPVHHVPAHISRPPNERRASSSLSVGMASVSISSPNERRSPLPGKEEAVPVGFDEGVLRALCDSDVGLNHYHLRHQLNSVWNAFACRPDKAVHRVVQGLSGCPLYPLTGSKSRPSFGLVQISRRSTLGHCLNSGAIRPIRMAEQIAKRGKSQ